MSEAPPIQKFLHEAFERAIDGTSQGKVRAKAWERFRALGLPSRKSEPFRYLSLTDLYAQTFHVPESSLEPMLPAPWPGCEQSRLAVVNGTFRPDLSNWSGLPNGVSVLPLAEAMKTYGTFLRQRWDKGLKREADPFATLNGAIYTTGVFLYVPPNTTIDVPLQLTYWVDGDHHPFVAPRLHLFVGRHSQVRLLTHWAFPSSTAFWGNPMLDLALEEGARVKLHQVQDGFEEAWLLDHVRATQKRDSHLEVVTVTSGGKGVRQSIDVALNGPNSEVDLNGVAMLRDQREAHTHVHVEHVAPHCRSSQLFKTALSGTARASFEGKIYVHPQAQKTDAFQLNNNLLLSERARAHSRPNLEILADDVKASHGSTVGQLDSDLLFYLCTRGIPRSEAKQLLIRGFLQEVIDQLTHPTQHDRAVAALREFMQHDT